MKKALCTLMTLLLLGTALTGCGNKTAASADATATLPIFTQDAEITVTPSLTPSAEATLASTETLAPTDLSLPSPTVKPTVKITAKPTVKLTAKPEIINERGNTTGNSCNQGIAAIQGDWIYYRNPEDRYSLYKIRTDGTEKKKIHSDVASGINVIGDWIYYETNMALDNKGLCRVKTDGTHRELLFSGWIMQILVEEEWIVFTSMVEREIITEHRIEYIYNEYLYKMRTDGSDKKQLAELDVCDFAVDSSWVYYNYNPDSGIEKGLYKIKMDGTGKKKINDDSAHYINVVDGWLFYVNKNEGGTLCKVRTDGTGRKKLEEPFCGGINVTGGWIYYCQNDDTMCNLLTYRMKTDGTSKQAFTKERMSCINIIGDWIYYWSKNHEDETETDEYDVFFRIHPDGSGKEKIQ